MTGSCSASGKCPLRPIHSISNDNIRNGAIFIHSPSGLCEIMELYTISNSICDLPTFSLPRRNLYVAAGHSIQLQPTISLSIMKRNTYGTVVVCSVVYIYICINVIVVRKCMCVCFFYFIIYFDQKTYHYFHMFDIVMNHIQDM